MWLFTRHGFFSITKSPVERNRMQIRARARHDLDRLNEHHGIGAEIIETPPPADYRWRIVVTPEQVAAVMAAEVAAIDYGNFKTAVHETPGQEDKSGPYMRVWAAMRGIQEPADHQSPVDRDLFEPDMFTHHAEDLLGEEAYPEPRDEPPGWVHDVCRCGHQRGDHLHGRTHCLQSYPSDDIKAGHLCDCHKFTLAAEPLDNPKAPEGKPKRKSRQALEAAARKGAK